CLSYDTSLSVRLF
nr:immunoglobulin light chain junction region [Macaca mulatta]MPN67898.1 immunoglobulin light chain junction region [Macaca mulatta]MPN68648.1 immunoglobulin light chain junction region [Macaca mulatta]MPN68777.1 immunoglobulin light chain junction region [Macaca mulatta]